MPSDDETQAEQSLRWIAPDRLEQIEGWRQKVADVPRLRTQLEGWDTDASDFMTIGLRETADRLLPVMLDQCPGSTAERLTVAGLMDDEVVATLNTFTDGSGRVLVSDGMASMLRLLADLSTIWYRATAAGGGWRSRARTAKALLRLDREEEIVPMLTVALRWNLVHRRAWGMSATLGVAPEGDDEIWMRDFYGQLGLDFVLAHECAHYLLGHEQSDIGSWPAERAADTLALASTSELLRASGDSSPLAFALLGARLAMLAAQLVEQALFVRPPVLHPPATERWRALAEATGDSGAVRQAWIGTAGLEKAVDKAADLRFELPEHWWPLTYRHPRVHCDVHDPAYYDHFWFLDRLSFGNPDDAATVLDRLTGDHGLNAFTAALSARDDGLAAGLRELGVEGSAADAVAQPGRPLSFHSLIELVAGSPELAEAPDSTTRRVAAVAAATLMGGSDKGIL